MVDRKRIYKCWMIAAWTEWKYEKNTQLSTTKNEYEYCKTLSFKQRWKSWNWDTMTMTIFHEYERMNPFTLPGLPVEQTCYCKSRMTQQSVVLSLSTINGAAVVTSGFNS